jgi:putative glutamine amidotransferase
MQLLNVICGGTLEQHIADADLHLHTPGSFTDHDVRLEPGSRAERAVGAGRISVRSHHHQGIGRLGEGLVVSGWSEPDGAAEAIELADDRFALGTLWHTEEERHSPVIAAVVEAARAGVAA